MDAERNYESHDITRLDTISSKLCVQRLDASICHRCERKLTHSRRPGRVRESRDELRWSYWRIECISVAICASQLASIVFVGSRMRFKLTAGDKTYRIQLCDEPMGSIPELQDRRWHGVVHRARRARGFIDTKQHCHIFIDAHIFIDGSRQECYIFFILLL